MQRRWHLVVLAVLGVLALACEGGAGSDPAPKPTATRKPRPGGGPASMAALGDSITAGVGSCVTYLACSHNSWSTGDNDGVDSHYRRILAKNPGIKGNEHNFAEPGAEADALVTQARRAVDAKAQYVTILIGANDACAGSVADMTPVATFRNEVDRGLAELKKGLPRADLLMVSIPDLYRLWQVGRNDDDAVRVWRTGGVCPSMLADPTSTASADERRRRAVRDRIDAYDEVLHRSCAGYGSRCRWDGGRVHGLRFSLDLVNRFDYFHPNLKGQNELADVTFAARN
ncbi:GDSL family lipase [Actinoplanes sp. SE50]|uniref:SGNH/GDSL hydrolase family protein n=1 Tax=unclassified Actinoplanes TaxID=2626549 RepID=UPI00023EBEA1|nr:MULTISPECIES: SGNH/GDSL hydrolase family protein [unclassified Actinoplanes]AEV82387.1 Phospholipase B1, membrane-associated [Actinoplanes sp. SE50/110]ATO80784.1 GDSL family lipase [Actinoplanes sp. SE50]SLL98192.1 lipase [Actinoplanes sp. SE50/110]